MKSSGLEHEPDSMIAAAMCGLLIGDTRCQHTLKRQILKMERKRKKGIREREEREKGDGKEENARVKGNKGMSKCHRV